MPLVSFTFPIQVHPTHIIVHECDIKRITRITINSTVPLYDDPEDWRDDIDIEFSVTGNAFNNIVSNSCSVSLPTKNEIEKASLSMKGVCNYIDGDSNTFHMNLMLASSHVFWDQYKLPTIKVWTRAWLSRGVHDLSLGRGLLPGP